MSATLSSRRAPHPLDSPVAALLAPRAPLPTAANSVVLALVVALLDLERPDTRGKVVTPMTRRRSA